MRNGLPSLYDLSWQVTEPEYRKDEALSYSTLAKYERGGRFNALPTLFDKISTASLSHGSAVDCLLTDGQEAFDNTYCVMPDCNLTPAAKKAAEIIYERFFSEEEDSSLMRLNIGIEDLIEICQEAGFPKNWRRDTAAKAITDPTNNLYVGDYVKQLIECKGKKILSVDEYTDVINCVNAINNSPRTGFYFCNDNDPDRIERFYQLKFRWKDENTGVWYRAMSDLIIVDHERKLIVPCDLKTSSHNEWDFFQSMCDWRYDLQNRLYVRGMQIHFKPYLDAGYTIMNYRDIVVNKKTLQPFVWEFKHTFSIGDLTTTSPTGQKFVWRDPYTIGAELHKYLYEKPDVPFGLEDHFAVIEDFIKFED